MVAVATPFAMEWKHTDNMHNIRVFYPRFCHVQWWGREDLNLHTLTGTCTSSMRVCQFRHDR